MASVAINFDKTLQERLDEYKEIFLWSSESNDEICTGQKRVAAYQMKKFWGNHLSVVLSPKGWKAIWRVPIRRCILMDLKHPSNVLVKVISINWENLSADVEVLKVNEHFVPSSKRIAALCELFPIEEQSTDYDPWLIADELDKYRFFHEYLWYPWDEIENDIHIWTEIHLEQRIQLLYDMVIGEVNYEDSERMRQLISDARQLQKEFEETGATLEELKEELEKSDDLEKGSEDLEELNTNLRQMRVQEHGDEEERVEMMMVRQLHLKRRLEDVQHEFEALEDPVLRRALANFKLKELRKEYLMNSRDFLDNNYNEGKEQKEKIINVAIICEESNFKEIREYLDYAESKFSNGAQCTVRFFDNLQRSIDLVHSKRTSYVISPGKHFMKYTEDLLNPGTTLAGVPEAIETTPTVIGGHSLGRTMMVVDWAEEQCQTNEKQESANLENLHFDPVGLEAILLVDRGSAVVKFCHFGHEKFHGDLPVIGAHNSPSTSTLPSYSRLNSFTKEIHSSRGESLPLPPLPITAAFECPKQRGIAVGAHGILEANESHFKGLHLAIIAYSGAKVTLSNCRFYQCQVAIRISKGAEVTVEMCVFEHSLANSIQYCAGTHEEQDEETQKIMEGKDEVITSSQILQRIPGVKFKDCIFISGDCSSEVCLRSVSEIAKSPKSKDAASKSEEKMVIEENFNESLVLLNEAEDDSVIILSDDD